MASAYKVHPWKSRADGPRGQLDRYQRIGHRLGGQRAGTNRVAGYHRILRRTEPLEYFPARLAILSIRSANTSPWARASAATASSGVSSAHRFKSAKASSYRPRARQTSARALCGPAFSGSSRMASVKSLIACS
jgi:hypothetical protein